MNIQSQSVTDCDMANAIHALTMEAVQKVNSGHPGLPSGLADGAAVLFNRVLTIDPADHRWPEHDRFALSAGHGSMRPCAVNHLLGHAGIRTTAKTRRPACRQSGTRRTPRG